MPATKKKQTRKTKKSSPRSEYQVRVRMYRQGLGDCHLITIGQGKNARHIMIDCGTLGATTTGIKLEEVVADIKEQTKDHLDLLICTHEHHDHLSGFGTLGDEFKSMKIENIWLAWTENPADKLAQKIAKNKEDLGASLTMASKVLTNSADSESQNRGLAIQGLLGFFNGDKALAAFSQSVNDAMNFVRKGMKTKAAFRNPGEGPLEESWLPGFRFYILGPPRSLDAINDTGEKGSAELYGMAAGMMAATRFRNSNLSFDHFAMNDPEERARFERELPFDARFRFDDKDTHVQDQFRESYFAISERWRAIDADWLHVASDLALQLDSATNNTSLAFALERISDGKVFLFPADAQQGNWLSWHDASMKWEVPGKGGKKQTITASDLLRRTVFYKVGHHGSHNATAKDKGLELMRQEDELVAFIPVDRAVALKRHPQGSWKMPARPLYKRLLEKCQGRVLRSDLGWADDAANAKDQKVEEEFNKLASAADWKKWKKAQQAAKHIDASDRLFIDYTN